jgi:plastocyanin
MTRRVLPLLFVLIASVLALAAWGGGRSSSSSTTASATGGGATTGGAGGGSTVQVAADPSGALKFVQTDLTATAGSVTIDFTNMSSVPHNVTLEGNGVSAEGTDTITGSSATKTFDLQPGTYTFYCSVDSHRAAGMEGKLVVN